MTKETSDWISDREARALRFLMRNTAHEFLNHPLEALRPLLRSNFARIRRIYDTPSHGPAREVEITEYGVRAFERWEDRQ